MNVEKMRIFTKIIIFFFVGEYPPRETLKKTRPKKITVVVTWGRGYLPRNVVVTVGGPSKRLRSLWTIPYWITNNCDNFSFVVQVGLEQIDRATGKRRISKLNLIDLAGNDSFFTLYFHRLSPEAIFLKHDLRGKILNGFAKILSEQIFFAA